MVAAQDAARARFLARVRAAGYEPVDEMSIPNSDPQGAALAAGSAAAGAPPVDSLPDEFEIVVDTLPISTLRLIVDGQRMEFPVYPITVEMLLKATRYEERMKEWSAKANKADDEAEGQSALQRVRRFQRLHIATLIPSIPADVLDKISNDAKTVFALSGFAGRLIQRTAQGDRHPNRVSG